MNNRGSIGVKVDVTTPHLDIRDKTLTIQEEIIGKNITEIPQYLSRIDSNLSSAHTLAYLFAVESILGAGVTKKTSLLRETMLKAEIISSHIRFIITKIMPKAEKTDSVYEVLLADKKEFKIFMSVLKGCEQILLMISKRHPHPINPVLGGFSEDISENGKKEIISIFKEMSSGLVKITELVAKQQHTSPLMAGSRPVSLREIDSVPYISGKVAIAGAPSETKAQDEYFKEKDMEENVFVGPLSRISNGNKLLSSTAEKLAKKYGLKFPLENISQNFICMAIEAVHCAERCIESLSNTHFEHEKPEEYSLCEGRGFCAIESAKGLIYHEYVIDSEGIIKNARIISNIAQNRQSLLSSVKNLPFDPDKKTRKQLIEEINKIIDAYYL